MSDPKIETKPKDAAKVEHPKMLVINNEERIHTMHVPREPGSKELAITGEPGDLLVLLPGVNLVDVTALRQCRTNPSFDLKFNTKIPRHVAKEAVSERVGQPILVEGPRVPASAPLSVLADEEAEKYVEEATTVELLNLFRIGEGRTNLRAKIDDCIRKIETGGGEIEAA